MSDQYDRALIRLSSAEDDKLEGILAKLLPIVFDELISQTEPAARNKIIAVLNHALTRCRGNKAIKLPVKSIIERWFSPVLKTSPNAPFFRNLAVIFVDLGVPRLEPIEQIELSLTVLGRFGELVSVSDRPTLFLASIPGLSQMSSEGFRKEQLPQSVSLIASKPADDPGLVAFFRSATEFLLIPCGSTDAPSVSGIASANWSFWKARLKGKAANDMIALKLQVLKWLGALAAAPPAALVYLPSLVASVDNYDAVVSPATSNCARLDPTLDLTGDEALLGGLVCAGLTSAPPGYEDKDGLLRVEPKANVPAKLRAKIISLLQRAPGIGTISMAPFVVHLVRQSIREQESVQMVSLQLALSLSDRCDPERLAAISAEVLKEVEDVFWPGGGVISMGTATPLAFRVFGSFARKLSELPGQEGRTLAIESAPRMLALLGSNEHEAPHILEALSGLVACLRGPTSDDYSAFVPLLDRLVASSKPVVRREVLRWATSLFPGNAPEGRYYALRLFGDDDPEIAKAAETALSLGRHESPPFADMCTFLGARALGMKFADKGSIGNEGNAVEFTRLTSQLEALGKTTSLPAPASGFTQNDLARVLSFLLTLADSEGLRSSADGLESVTPPSPKKPRLSGADAGGSMLGECTQDAVICFTLILDYLLADTLTASSANAHDTVADGMTILELSLRGLHLTASLAGGDLLLKQVLSRVELVLFTGGPAGGTLFREGGYIVGRARRLGAVVAGSLCEQIPEGPDSPLQRWFEHLAGAIDGPLGSAQRAGGVLAICELLRVAPSSEKSRSLCRKALSLLLPDGEKDTAVLSSACDGLRRLSERHRLVWDVLDEGSMEPGSLGSRQQFLDHLYSLSKIVTSGLGDTKEAELGTGQRDLIHASWRLLGQLAAWSGDGAAECVDRLVDIGRQTTGEEAAAALGLALSAACSDPLAPRGHVAVSVQAEALLQRLLQMVEDMLFVEDGDAATKKKTTVAEREALVRCGTTWVVVLLRRLANCTDTLGWLDNLLERLCRILVGATSSLSVFTADCGLKGICYLYRLAPGTEARAQLLKTTFSSVSNRTSVQSLFVGPVDTKTRREEEERKKKDPNYNDSLRISAKERVDSIKDLMFLARDLNHNALFVALLDQPSGSIWTSEIFREALDLQSPCLPDSLKEQLCPTKLRPRLFPFFFHNSGPLRQALVKMFASYFGCESPTQILLKYPDEWNATAQALVMSLGSARVATRQASIQAAQVIFRGREWADVGPLLDDLWAIVIKLMDDMEPDVQASVKPLVRMLRNLTLRLCDLKVSKRSNCEAAIKVIVPILLLNAERFKHAQPFCFEVMREMVKSAHGTTLMEPYVQDLVPPLLISLSMLEHEQLQYYQFHVDNANADKGKELETARISASRDSESMRLLRQLVPLVSAENAEALAPRTRDQLVRGVGANTRVGVCDFWGAVCAERSSAVPTGGSVATQMLRALAGALLDPSVHVRSAAASCFASFARRSKPEELTKVIFDRLMKQDKEYRTDDEKRSSFRISLARALWEVFRRCDDSLLEPELKAAIAAKAFPLRYSEEQELKTAWEPLWNELCPTTSSGVEKHYKGIATELAECFIDSTSRVEKITNSKAVSAYIGQLEKKTPRPVWSEDAAVVALHKAVHNAVATLPIFDGNGALVRALADISALIHRRKRNEQGPTQAPTEDALGLPLLLGFCAKGSLADRAESVRAVTEVMSAVRVWGTYKEAGDLYASAAARVDELQRELEAEKREPGEQIPVKHRGKAQSPAEELLTAVLDLWASTFEQGRREAEDEGDLEPPDEGELADFVRACLAEFYSGSLSMRLTVIRFWKRVFGHLKEERISLCSHLDTSLLSRIATAVQDATFDNRSERLRRPALEFAAALVADEAPGGGREALRRGIGTAVSPAAVAGDTEGRPASRTLSAADWIGQLDPNTVEMEKAAVATLKAALLTADTS